MSDDEYKITDFDDRPIEVGTRVRYYDYKEGHPEFPDGRAKYEGAVSEITEFDGDCGDDGRSITIYPKVVVRFDSGDSESYSTCEWEIVYGQFGGEPVAGKVEELDVIVG